eukprot:1746948-Prymnesium_polylepis.2
MVRISGESVAVTPDVKQPMVTNATDAIVMKMLGSAAMCEADKSRQCKFECHHRTPEHAERKQNGGNDHVKIEAA